jgi:hypothetical protein
MEKELSQYIEEIEKEYSIQTGKSSNFFNYLRKTQSESKVIICSMWKFKKDLFKTDKKMDSYISIFNSTLDQSSIVFFIKEINKRLNKLANKSLQSSSTTAAKVQNSLVRAFDSHFEVGDMFTEFYKYCLTCISRWKGTLHSKPSIFSPIGVMCQSSGHGKTRTMKEFSKLEISLFICLRDKDKDGMPGRSPIADDFLKAMDTKQSAINFLFNLVYTALDLIEEIKANNGLTYNRLENANERKIVAEKFFAFQPWYFFESEMKNDDYSFYFEFEKKLKERIEQNQNVINSKSDNPIENSKRILTKRMEQVVADQPLFVFLDEAMALLSDSMQKNLEILPKFRVMRRAINELFSDIRIAFILSDTNARLTNLVPSKQTVSSSTRLSKLDVYEPFYGVLYIDELVPKTFNSNELSFESIQKRDPNESVFRFGRPLWASLIQQGSKSVYKLASEKILCANDWEDTNINKKLAALAIFSIRTTITLNYQLSYSKEMVERHMATLFYVSKERDEIAFKYISEPILAESAASLLSNENHQIEMLKCLNSYVQTMYLEAAGSIGEIVAQIILLLAFDNGRKMSQVTSSSDSLLYTAPIQVKTFLLSLIGEKIFEAIKDNMNSDLLDGLLCFTHFERKFDRLNIADTKRDFIARSAAGQFKPKEPGYDLFIPILLPNNQITYILIQVKNWKKSPSKSQINVDCPHKKYFEGNRIISFLPIFIHVGVQTDSNSVFLVSRNFNIDKKRLKINMLVIDGVNKTNYPFLKEESINVLNQMANCDRNLFKSPLYDPKIIKQVGVVNMSKESLDSMISRIDQEKKKNYD